MRNSLVGSNQRKDLTIAEGLCEDKPIYRTRDLPMDSCDPKYKPGEPGPTITIPDDITTTRREPKNPIKPHNEPITNIEVFPGNGKQCHQVRNHLYTSPITYSHNP